MPAPVMIIGGGLAAATTARTLRREGYDGDVLVLCAEPHHPYERPPLSKDYLRGEADRSALFHPSDAWYADNDVEVRTGTAVAAIDPGAHRVTLADGSTAPYRRLVLATGSSPRALAVPGADLRGVLTLRTAADADLLAASMDAALRGGAGRLVVVGDGWIGTEVAASARARGMDVTLLGRGAVPLARSVGDAVGAVYATLHRDHGVRLRPRSDVVRIVGTGQRVSGVELDRGDVVPADLVVVGIGAVPNVGLAAAAGIATVPAGEGGGVAVDGRLQTSAPDVWAVGDIAAVPSPIWGRRIRVEHWATAMRTGPHAARAVLGADAPYARLPYFFSDQYDTSMEFAGFVDPRTAHDVVMSGDPAARTFAAFWTAGGVVHAGLTMNVPDRIGEIEALIAARKPVAEEVLRGFVAA